MFELLVIETSPICQPLLSKTKSCLAEEGNVQLTSLLKGWVSDLSVEKFFYNPLPTYFCRGRPLSWRNPFLSFRKWFVRAQFSAFFKARFWGGGWDQPYFFWSAQTQSFQNHWDFLMQFKDQSFHLHTVTLLVVTNSFKIPSHRAPQIHENTSKCSQNHSCLVTIICIKHFCIFIVSDHETMAVGDNILQRGTDAGDREKASVFLRSTNSTPRNIVTRMALCQTIAKPYLHMKGPD